MKRLALLLAFLLVVPPALAQEEAPPEDIPIAPYDIEDLTYPDLPDFEIPQPTRVELDNGMVVFLIENHELPTIEAQARIGVGGVYAPDSLVGLASVTGSVLRTGGTAEMTPQEVNVALESVGAVVETGIGSTSGYAYMSTLAEHVDTVLPIFADILMHPAFAEEKVGLAKTQAKTSIARRNNNPTQIASREFSQLLYGEDSPWARVPQYWTIDAIDRGDLVRFYERFYHPNNTLLSIWGDFETEAMIEKIRAAFGGWEPAPAFERPPLPPREGEMGYSMYFIPKSDVTQSTVFIGHPGELLRSSPDYPPVIIMNEILSGGFASRLFQNVRSEKGLAYAVLGQYVAGYTRPGPFYAGVLSKSGTTVEAARAVLHEIERMRQAPPSEDEVELAKDSYLNAFVFNFDSGREIVSRLMTYEYYDYPRDFLNEVKSEVEAVTAEDVFRVSKAYLHPGQADILVLGKREAFNDSLAVLTKAGEVQTIDVTIPTQPPGEEEPAATAEQQAAGQDLLMQVKEALGGTAFEEIESFRTATTTTIETPMGARTIENTLVVELPGMIHAVATLPNGMTITIIDSGEEMILKTPRGTQPAPAAMRQQTLGQLWHSLPYLLARAGEVEAAAAGTVEIEGQTYTALEITTPQDASFTLLIDPETMRPARIQYQGTNPRTGAPFEAVSIFSDYREVDGITIPFTTTIYQDGQKRGTSTVQSYEINVDLEEGLFSVE